MELIVLGAGAVGLNLGGRLALAGHDVLFAVRREAVANAINRRGVALEDCASGETASAPAKAVLLSDLASSDGPLPPVVICTRTTELEVAARELAAAAPDAIVVGAQNDVTGDALLARHFGSVLGLVVRQTSTRTDTADVRYAGNGRLVLGLHRRSGAPESQLATETRSELAASFESAGFDTGITEDLPADRWLKLCANLMSSPNALVRRTDHRTQAFVEVKARLLEEARAALAAAGIRAASGDGRDRSLDEEIEFQRASLASGESARDLPLYNQVWASLQGGGEMEATGYHARIIDLAVHADQEAPTNQRLLDVLRWVTARGLGAESVGAADLLPAEE